jgi:hypothetical protein
MEPQTLPDQQTSHESAPDEALVGRFSTGLETGPLTREKLHRGRFSEGLECAPQTARKRHTGRFSDGLEQLPETARKTRRGSFADRQPVRGNRGATVPGARASTFRPRPG